MNQIRRQRTKYLLLPIILVAFLLTGCATTPWKKATVTTYELTGITTLHVKDTAEHLRMVGAIDEATLAKVKEIYNKAERVHETAGNILITAIETEDTFKRDALLEEYDRLLMEFRDLAYEINDLLNKLK